MSLEEAVEAVKKIEQLYRTSAVDRTEAARVIGYTTLSGPANKALAALASYGLVERAGKGEMRVTKGAQAILHPDDDDERNRYLIEAALNPELFQSLQEKYPGIMPPEDGIASYLSRQGFNKNVIRKAARAYLETLRYLKQFGANVSHGMQSEEAAESPPEDDEEVSMNEVAQQTAATDAPISARRYMLERAAPSHKFEEGESEWLRTKVGFQKSVRLLTKGEFGPTEIGHLIRMLEFQKEILQEQVDEEKAAIEG
jgi:hypothetical protein